MQTYADVINCWPSAEEFARDLGISGVRARQWRNRNGIPARYWRAVIEAADRRDIAGITLDLLSKIETARAEPAPADDPSPCEAAD